MKRLSFLLSCALLLSLIAPAAYGQDQDWQQIVKNMPKLSDFHAPEPRRIVLPNGMIIFLQEDHELPLIDGVARIRGGSRLEPASKVGLTDIYGEVWRTGGTKAQTGDQLDDFLESRAAKVETGGGIDSTTIGWSSLKGDFDDVFKVFVDLLDNPAFRPDKLEIAQHNAFDGISRRNDDINSIVGRQIPRLAYGPNNPYGRDPEYATIAAITQQDLIKWHDTYVHPNNIILGIVGDFDSSAMEAKLRQAFGNWTKGAPVPKEDFSAQPAKPGYYVIPKTDVNQSSINMIGAGTKKDSPDFYAIQVFNEAFGGGFSSRLFRDLRTTKGLAYSVGGGIGTRFDHPGILHLGIGTKSQTTIEAIQGLYQEIDDLKTNPLSAEEIQRAKDSILNSFVFNFDTPEKVLRERMAYEFYGYPQDFLEKFKLGIEKVQPPDVAGVAAKYLHKDQLAVLVVGNTGEFEKPLTSLGPVNTIDITTPAPPGEKAPAGSPSNQ